MSHFLSKRFRKNSARTSSSAEDETGKNFSGRREFGANSEGPYPLKEANDGEDREEGEEWSSK